ncbi:MAG TPA: nuclear transport factor 2 family protein [Gemmatimonadales bacterium]|nr:nuclear transport factor 2 family protein [Gemmatimonadales bacterium]
MATQTIEAEVLELEQRFWQAMKDLDVETAASLTAEPCLLTGAQGASLIDRKTFREMMRAPNYTLDRFELKEGAHVRQLRDDVVVVGYEAHEELTVEGKPVKLDVVETSVWVRNDGRWLCAAHTEAIKGDPFGRDRGVRKG